MRIAIAGYGAEGESNYRYWNRPENQVVIIDERQPTRPVPVDASVIVGEDAFNKLEAYDMVIRSPGIAPHKIKTDGKIWSATNEFVTKCPATIIGVTGSKGKGTTCSLIASILRTAGKTVHLVGNIGVPSLDVLNDIQADDIVVYELSSFQLWDIEKSPHVAVVLMIEPDHLDVHANFKEYIEAKGNIARHQTSDDTVVYNGANEHATAISHVSKGARVAFQASEAAHVAKGYFWYGAQKLCSVDALRIAGAHNEDNACAAINAIWNYVQNPEVIAAGLESFTGLPHRLKFVRELNCISYFDDSIATTPGSAIAAIKAFTQPKVLILGGSDKGSHYDELVETIGECESIRKIITIGEQGPIITQLLQEKNHANIVHVETAKHMTAIVATATSFAQPGDVVILSPACASFDMFKSYSDRGDQFIDAVNNLQES